MSTSNGSEKAAEILRALESEHASLSIDEIRHRLGPVFKGMAVRSPLIDPGMFLYRARRVAGSFHTSRPMSLADLKYPPPHCARLGRANRDGHPMFYASSAKEPIFFELGELKSGDEIILSSWRTRSRMVVNNIGYTQLVFDQLGAKRECPTWDDKTGGKAAIAVPPGDAETLASCIPREENDALRLALSKLFMQKIDAKSVGQYKLTAAIAEAHLGRVEGLGDFAGIMYPSVRMWANGDNFALTPEFVDGHLEFRRATRVRIDKCKPTGFDVSNIECAREFDGDGNLMWLGRLLHWQVPPSGTAVCTGTAGRDSDGEYSASKDGSPCYWVVRDAATGQLIEPN